MRRLLAAGFVFSLVGMASLGNLAASAAAQEAKSGWVRFREGSNVLGNGDLSLWDGYRGKGVTVTSVGVPIGSIPKHWYGGPGGGATATYDVIPFPPGQTDVPGNPKWHLRIAWAKPPAADWPGEVHHKPQFRCTVLENFSMTDVRRFANRTMLVRFYARVQRGPLDLIPILWHSYDSQTPGVAAVKGKGYELFEIIGPIWPSGRGPRATTAGSYLQIDRPLAEVRADYHLAAGRQSASDARQLHRLWV